MDQDYGTLGGFLGVRGPLWVVSRYDTSGDVGAAWLTFELSGMGTILPVFSSGDDARGFLKSAYHGGERGELKASQTGRARLTLELMEPLVHVDRIAFDPLPEPELRQTVELASLSRAAFVDLMLGRGRGWSDQATRHRPFLRRKRDGAVRS